MMRPWNTLDRLRSSSARNTASERPNSAEPATARRLDRIALMKKPSPSSFAPAGVTRPPRRSVVVYQNDRNELPSNAADAISAPGPRSTGAVSVGTPVRASTSVPLLPATGVNPGDEELPAVAARAESVPGGRVAVVIVVAVVTAPRSSGNAWPVICDPSGIRDEKRAHRRHRLAVRGDDRTAGRWSRSGSYGRSCRARVPSSASSPPHETPPRPGRHVRDRAAVGVAGDVDVVRC